MGRVLLGRRFLSEAEVVAAGVEGMAGAGVGFRMHHVGLAVAELEPAAEFLTSFFGYRVVSGPFEDPIQRVRVLFLSAPGDGGAELELVAPLTEDSPIGSMLRRSGGGSYHSCFETADLDGALAAAMARDCVVLSGAGGGGGVRRPADRVDLYAGAAAV